MNSSVTDSTLPDKWHLMVAASVAGLGGLLFGYDNIVISGAIRGASRSGRYAKRSIATPSAPTPAPATTNISSSRSGNFDAMAWLP